MQTLKFKGYQRGTKDGVITYKCYFESIDKFGFTTTVVKYLNQEEFDKLPKLTEGVKA